MKRCLPGLGLLSALLLGLASPAHAEIWRFALIGDTPYSDYERGELPKMLNAIGETHVDFIAHIGDIKHSKDRCDDALYEDRRQLFDSVRSAFIYIPGDNEWSDCDRVTAGAYQPEERLNKLRQVFFSAPHSLGHQRIALDRQAGPYVEHARFRVGPVLFVTLNIPGGYNNWGLTEQASQEWRQRDPMVRAWLKEGFALAKKEKLKGIAILFQADPDFQRFSQGIVDRAYRPFLTLLREETLNFPGQVLAIHGDTHISRIDHPMRDSQGKTIANFTRVETHGYPLMGWTRGIIDSDSSTLFRFETYTWPPKNP